MTGKTPETPQDSRPATGTTASVPVKAVEAYPGGSAPGASATQSAKPATASGKAPKPVVNAALKRKPRERTLGRGSTVLALLAVLVAFGAVLVAVYSLNVARQAKSSAAVAASDAQRAASVPRANAPAPAPAPTASPVPTTPAPVFTPELRGYELTIPPTKVCESLFVDADTGQVGNYTGHEFYFSSCVGPLTVYLDNVDGAVATGGNTTPEACAALLTGTTPTSTTQFPVTPGMTFCLLTSKAAAARAGIPQRLAVVQIRQIASDRTVTATLDTYRVPS
jgi:hypothetical protein